MKKFFEALLAVLFVTALFSACEVGLGASVDTYPPTLTVAYPSGDSLVIRDTFVMSGKSDDETSVASVTVTFKPTESSTAPAGFTKTYNAEFEPRGTSWTCTINNKSADGKYEIPDGEYQVTILATDSASRTTTVTRVYKIDNTAPLVVIKRPADSDSYGRTLKVTADVSDENTLGTLTFTPYTKNEDGTYETVKDESGNAVVYTQNNISGNGLEAIIARWYDSPSTDDQVKQNNLYRKMLGSDSTSAKNTLYYAVKVNDKAESYPGTGVVSEGNVSSEFYIYDDIYADIYSDSSSDGVHLGLTNKQLIQILNGNTTGETAESAKTALANKKYACEPTVNEDSKLTFDKAVKFSISPDNSPTYTVGGYEYVNEGSSQTSITNDGVINVTVSVGADQISLKSDTVRLVVVPAELNSEKTLVAKTGAAETVLLESPENYNKSGYSGSKTAAQWDALRSEKMKIGDNITIAINIGTLVAGDHYIVKVEGRDAENIEIEAESGKCYGFMVSQNSQPPVVSIESAKAYDTTAGSYSTAIGNNSDIPDAKIQVAGKVSVETKKAKVTYKISVTDGSGTSNTSIYSNSGTVLAMPSEGWDSSEHDWTWTASDAEINAIKALDSAANPSYTTGLYLMTVSFDAESSSGLSTTNSVTRTFYIDTSAPEVTDVVVSPVVTYDEAIDTFAANKDYVNGTITIKANVNDNHTVSGTDYTIKAGETEIQSGRLTGNIIKINSLNTAANSDYNKKDLTVVFTPYDKAGNGGTAVSKTVTIDQDTDKPVIKITNADKSITSAENVNKDQNLFDLTTNNKILGSVTDDDQLGSISVQWKKADAADSTYADLYGFPKVTTKTSEAITIQFVNKSDSKKLSEGLYKIKVTGTDENSVTGTAEFCIAIDDKDPALKITSESDKFQSGTVTVKGTVQDSSNKITVTSPKNGVIGIYEVSNITSTSATVTKKLTETGTAVTLTAGTDYTVSNSVVTINWTDSFACVTGGESISYTAEDKYGKSSTAAYSYKEDQVAPAITVTSPSSDVFLGSTLTSFQKFTGTASDANSGVSSIEYKYGVPSSDTIQLVSGKWTEVDSTKAAAWLNSGWQTANGTTDWNLNLDCSSGYADGSCVWFRAVDVAGNKTALADIKSVSVTIDSDVPSISITKITSGGTEITPVSNVYYVTSADLVITGTVAETYVPVESGVQKCLTTDNSDGTLSASTTSTGLDFTFSISASKLAAGQKSIRFTAKDKATQNSSESVTIFVDKEAPNVEIGAITPQVSANDKDNNVNGTITVSGNASDDDKVSKTVLYINDTAATDASGSVLSSFSGKVTKVTYSDGGTRFSYKLDTTKWTDKSALTVKFVTTDRSGNVSAVNAYDAASESSYNKKELYIDQSTDKPTLSSTNMTLTLTSADGVSSADGGNLYGMGSQTIYVTAGDDDGVKSFTYKIDSGTETTLYTGSSTSVTKEVTFPDELTGTHKITFVVTDINGTSYTPDPVYFAIDNDTPVLSEIKIGGKTYEKSMFVPQKIAITGAASDSSGIKTVGLTGAPSGTTCTGTTSWTSSEITEETEGSKTVIVKATDIYGRAVTQTLEFRVDTTAPVWQETAAGAAVPTTIKGGQKSWTDDTITSSDWFNSDSITLSGKAYDVNEIAGYTLSVNSGAAVSANGGGSYSIIASYIEGYNSVKLTATDTAGNSTVKNLYLYVDTVSPEVTAATVNGKSSGTQYINNSSTVTIAATASDATSGVSKILAGTSPSFKESDAIAVIDLSSVTASSGSKSGSVDLTSAVVSALSEGTNTIYIRAVDVSGLSSSETAISGIVKDTTAPAVEYTSHSANAEVNKTITLGGTFTELNKKETSDAVLYYKKSSDTGWTSSSNTLTVDNTAATWKVDFNTAASGMADDTSYDFQIRMSDAAGNTVDSSASYITLKVSQNSDRPVIKLNFATDGTARLNNGIFAGTITDDDGDVKKLYIQTVADGGSLSDSSWTELSVSSGSWQLSDSNKLSDGTYSLYFKVIDAKDTTFITSSTDGLAVPYMQYSSNAKVYAPVTFSVDTTAATISLVDVTLASASGADASYSGTSIQNNKVLGGASYRYAKFKINAEDSVSKGNDLSVKVNFADTDYTASYSSADKVYYTDEIDLSDITSGIYQLTVTATDQAGMAKTFTKMVIIDNSAPVTIKNVTPANTTEVTGDFSLTGLVQDDEDANSGLPDGTAMWYYIPKYSERNTAAANLGTLSWSTTNFTRSSVTWTLKLSDLATTIGYNSETEAVGSDYSGYAVTGNSALYNIPVWFKIMDNAGNIGYNTENFVHYNPNADKPTVEITYPGESEKDKTSQKIIMGGTARFQGSASDNEGIEGVYLQFDMDGNGTWENGAGVTGVAVNSSGKVYAGGDTTNIAQTIPKAGGNGFKAKGTLTWTSSIDLSGLSSGTTIKVRAIAIDSDSTGQLASAWTETVEINVNNSIPQLSDMNLVQYTDSTYATIQKQIAYSEDVYISGSNWRLEGLASHKDGIASVTVDTSNSITTAASGTNKTFAIPLNKTSGSWTGTITATDTGETPHPKTLTVSVNIDNTAPAFADGSGELVLYKDMYGTAANKLSSTVYVQNSDGTYVTLSSKATEEGSGFARAVFYFERAGSSENRVYNVMKSYGTDRTANKTVVAASKADGSVYINSEGLAVLYKKTVTRNSTTSIELTSGGTANIRAGGLVKIGGAYHRIAGVSDDYNTITLEDEVDTKFASDVEFVYGMVVDNSGESRDSSGTLKNDDGDKMVETYAKSGSNYTWEATVPSANIPDGPIQIHVVLFDKAGNTAHSYVTTRISNNAPRITSVKLGTDLNGNGSYTSDEYTKFYALSSHSTSSGVETWNLDTSAEMETKTYWTAKNGLSVVPEFVGGTAPFKYAFTSSVLAANLASPVKTTDSNKKKGDLTVSSTDSTTGAVTTSSIDITNAEIDTTLTTASGEDGEVTYQFSFWDSTEETTAGVDSSWTILNAKVHQDLKDGNKPSGHIKPFFWNSSSDNSLYNNSKDNGHIELEGDLTGTAAATSYGTDPKVSGKIVFRGLIYDDVRLKTLTFTFADFGAVTISTYSSGSWSTYTDGTGGKIPSATVKNVSLDQNGHLAEYEIEVDTSMISGVAGLDKTAVISVTDATGNTSASSTTQTANTVSATYYATETQAANHRFFTTEALAAADGTATSLANSGLILVKGAEATAGSGIYTYTKPARTPYYKMDVVPYITGISTPDRTNSGLKDNNIRSASGKYSVMKGTTSNFIEVSGFNFGTSASGLSAWITPEDSSNGRPVTGTLSTSNATALTVNTYSSTSLVKLSNNIAYSGYVELVTNSVRTLNNLNSNDAHGSFAFTGGTADAKTAAVADYADMPNREADYYTTKNVQLNDDRYLRLFDMKDTPIKNGYYPTMVMNGDNPVFGYIDLNGINETYRSKSLSGVSYPQYFGYVSGCYQTQKAEFVGTTGAIKDGNIDYMFGTISADQVGFCKDSAGKYFYSSVYNYSGAHMAVVYDSYAEKHTWSNGYRTDGWGDGTGYSGYSGDYAYNGNNDAISLESVNYGNGLLIGRYQNIRMLAKGDSTSTTGASVYMAYYDDNTTDKNVIFRTFKVGQTNYSVNTLKNGYSNLADQDTAGRIAVGTNGSSYLDLGVTSDNHVVIVYYDSNDSKLKLKYSSAAIDGSSTTCSGITWNTSSVSFPLYVGNYVSMAIDSDDHIHIAAYDAGESDLMYFYLDNYASGSAKSLRVDQAFAIGTWTRIAVNSSNIPYIAYYNSTETGSRESIKLCYATAAGASVSAGVDSNNYTTGGWEYMTVPAINPPQGGDAKFKNVNLDFDSSGRPVVGYLATNLEFGKQLDEQSF